MDCEREKASMQGLDNDTPRKKKNAWLFLNLVSLGLKG